MCAIMILQIVKNWHVLFMLDQNNDSRNLDLHTLSSVLYKEPRQLSCLHSRELVEYYTQHIIQQMRGPSKFYTFLVSIESPNWIGQPSMNVTGNRETFKRKLHCGNHAIVLLNLTLPAWVLLLLYSASSLVELCVQKQQQRGFKSQVALTADRKSKRKTQRQCRH